MLGLSFQFARQIMKMKLSVKDRNFGNLLRVKNAIATSMFGVAARVQSSLLRPESQDAVAELLAEIEREQRGGDAADPTEQELLAQLMS